MVPGATAGDNAGTWSPSVLRGKVQDEENKLLTPTPALPLCRALLSLGGTRSCKDECMDKRKTRSLRLCTRGDWKGISWKRGPQICSSPPTSHPCSMGQNSLPTCKRTWDTRQLQGHQGWGLAFTSIHMALQSPTEIPGSSTLMSGNPIQPVPNLPILSFALTHTSPTAPTPASVP